MKKQRKSLGVMRMRDPKAPRRGETLTPEDLRRRAIEETEAAREELQIARERSGCQERTSFALSAHAIASVAIELGRAGGFGPGSDVIKNLQKTKHDAASMLKSLSCTRR